MPSRQVNLPESFDPASCILFLGSGFSADATNIMGRCPPAGNGLKLEILQLLAMEDSDIVDLKDVAAYAARNDVDLFVLLTRCFTIKGLTDDQRAILARPWRRIYTTNYDDAVEYYHTDAKTVPIPYCYSFEDDVPAKIPSGTIVHLHGYIHRATRENVASQLVLTHYSYSEQAARNSPWFEQFERDLRTAEAAFFLGYSLNDFAVSSYLTKSPDLAIKCHFILRPDPGPIMRSRIEDYGKLHTIAVQGFAEKCRALGERRPLLHANSLQAFRYFDPHKDNKAAVPPTPVEIDTLMALGNFKLQRLLATFPEPTYVVPRSDAIANAVAALETRRNLIIHSNVGNGKTIFTACLSMRLSVLGHTVFECRESVTIPERDLDYIRTQAKPVIVFSTYDNAYVTLSQLTDLPPATRIIVEMSTGTLQVRRTEVDRLFGSSIHLLDLNRLSRQDLRDLHNLLDRAGIAPADMEQRFQPGVGMREIVLLLYNNQEVSRRIRALVKPMFEDPDFKRVLYCSIILKAMGLKVDPTYMRNVTKVDPYGAVAKFAESAHDIMSFDLDAVDLHSALLGDYLIRKHVDARELMDWIYQLAVEAGRRLRDRGDPQSSRQRDARQALGGLLRHSQLCEFLKERNDRDELISHLYESARDNTNIEDDPLFWLQYAIFMESQGKLDLAERHIQAAYTRAARRPGFQTYQLDTFSLGLFVELETNNTTATFIERFDAISERLERMDAMLSEGSHRGHVLRVLMKLESFVRIRRRALAKSEGVALTYRLNLLIAKLDSYDQALRIETNSEQTKASLKRAVDTLLDTGLTRAAPDGGPSKF